MNEQFIRERISRLRENKGVSEYKMSLELGHSKSYIQSISSGKALPSLTEFLYICEYLGISPKDFFDNAQEDPALVQELYDESKAMEKDELAAMLAIAKCINKKN